MQIVGGVVGAVIGWFAGGPQGAAYGWAIGSAIGAAAAAARGSRDSASLPSLSDLRVPQIEYGARIPRFYGRNRTAGMVPWRSDMRSIDAGGFYTYEVDVLYQLCIDSDVQYLTRVWYQKTLVWSRLAESTGATIGASEQTDKWSAIEFFNGNPEQLPWSVYEAVVGQENAIGYRGRATVGITGLQCGPNGELPLLEFEVITNGAQANVLRTAYVLELADAVNAGGPPPFGNIGAGLATYTMTNGYAGNYQDTINYGIFASLPEARGAALAQFPTSGNYGSAHNRIRTGGPSIVSETQNIVSGTLIQTTINYILPLACDPAGGGYGSCSDIDPDYVFRAEVIITSYIDPKPLFSQNADMFSVSVSPFLSTNEDSSQANQGRILYGSSDGSFAAVVFTDIRIKAYYSGVQATYLFSSNTHFNNRDMIYSVRGNFFYCMTIDSIVPQLLHKFNKAGGLPILSTLSLGYYPHSIAANDTTVYILNVTTQFVKGYDATSLVETESFAPPTLGGNDKIFCDAAGKLWIYCNGEISRRDGTAWTLVHTVAGINSAHIRHSPQFVNGVLYITASEHLGGVAYRETAYAISDTVSVMPVSLADILRAEYLRCKPLTLADFDVSPQESISVTGYAALGSARQCVDQSMAIYYFEQVCSDKIYHPERGGASEVTITFDQTGAGVDQASEPFTGVNRENDLEIPIEYALTYQNVLSDYENGTEHSNRVVGLGAEVRQISTGFVLTPAEAKGRVTAITMDARVGSHIAEEISVTNQFAAQQPTSVITVVDDEGSSYRLRIVRETYANGVKKFATVLDDPGVLVFTGITNENYTPAITVTPLGATELIVLDIPIIRDADDGPSISTAVNSDSDRWTGATIRKSSDGITYETAATHTTEAIIGTASTALAAGALYVWDEASKVTITLRAGGTLSSSTRDAMQADGSINVAAIGSAGRWELVRFRSAALVSSGVYLLSGLLRGMFGTEWAAVTHQGGDTFVLLTTAGVRRVGLVAGDLGMVRYFKGVTLGRNDSTAPAQTVTVAGVGLEPYAPTNLRAARDVATGDITFTWSRRTRLAVRYGGPGGSVIPLGEASESYELHIISNTGTIARIITSTSESAAYSAAQQTTDFGSIQASVGVIIYQISSNGVARGYPLVDFA